MNNRRRLCFGLLYWCVVNSSSFADTTFTDTSVAEGAGEEFAWPEGAKAAVSLAYDDALNSQLDNALPALDRHGLKGSFYVTGSSRVLVERLEQWRAAAARGHELGNHSLFHQCRASKPGREWVEPHNDLDHTRALNMVNQVKMANSMLHMIDGKSERTYTAPCGDRMAAGEDYIKGVERHFVAIKLAADGITPTMENLDPHAVSVVAPVDLTGEQLIALVQEAAAKGTMANLTFHGVGGDYLAVSEEAHNQLLAYLASHRDTYYVDTFLNIMKHVKNQQDQ